jgi:hypothetical protein
MDTTNSTIEEAITFRNSEEAFRAAIDAKILSVNEDWENYAGNYMYMYTNDGRDWFKNINTRHYLGGARA